MEFSFSENKITVLPDAVFQMPNLQYLTGFKNLLGNFPKNVDDCQSLQEIDLSWNRIGGLPKEIGNLPHLRILKLNNNLIKAIPFEAGTMASLEEIQHVGQSDGAPALEPQSDAKPEAASTFPTTFITEVPACIGELQNLEYLDLSFNLIWSTA
jgi:Leucine-rich repeat (LRR) protein